jgi:non-ribosomal peptide synthetase component F
VASGELAAQFAYWQTRLRGCPTVLELPFARPRAATRTFNGATKSLNLSAATTAAVRALSQRQAVSLYTTLLAAFAVLVGDYTGRGEFVLGRGIPGRTSSEIENLIGCFVNLLPLRIDTSGSPTFQELLRRVSETVNTAYANQDAPFVKLVETLEVETPAAYPPLVQLVFNLYTAPDLQPLTAAAVRSFDLGAHTPTDDVALFQDVIVGIKDSGRELTAEARFNRALFAPEAIERMLADYRRLLGAAATRPELSLSDLSRMARA